MTRGRQLARLVGSILLVLAGAQVLDTVEAGAAGVDAYGWWSQASPDQAIPLPAAVAIPGAPTDGLYVGIGPNVPGVTGPPVNVDSPTFPLFTPIAVGAVRFSVPEPATARLELPVTFTSNADDVNNDLTQALLACQLDRPDWEPAQNGGWDKRPAFDCNAYASIGTLFTRDGLRFASWDLQPAYQNPPGVVNVAIVAFANLPMFIAFGAPGDDAVKIIDQGTPIEEPVDAGTEVVDGSAGFVDDGLGAVSDGVVGIGDVAPAVPPATAGGETASGLRTGPTVPTALPPSGRSRPVSAVDETKGRGWAVLGLALLGVLLFFYGGGSRQVAGVAMRGVGRFRGPVTAKEIGGDEAPVRGIGRFAATRTEPPRRLL